jgi:hypothetical protein|tara:strand:+ start:2226 stop:2645 length:420 start_codon:yes stop_codon:yes gene_type:complete
MIKHSLPLAALAPVALLSLAACAVVPNAGPVVDSSREVAQQGSVVPLLQPVQLGQRTVVTPMRVTEDSRCPQGVQCIQAGRVIVETRIDGPGWRQTQPLTLGEPHSVRGITVTLASVEPEQRADPQVKSAEYRFAFEGG